MDALTDAQLAVLSQQGDRKAFGFLARRCDGQLFRFLCRLLGNEAEARDLCQETLLKAYLNISRLREPGHFRAWVHQIALNLCRDHGRSRGLALWEPLPGTSPTPAEDGYGAAAGTALTPLVEAERANLAGILVQVLGRLPFEQRMAILLCEVHGFTSAEAGRIAGVPAATVRSRLFHGLKALRRLLPEYGITDTHLAEGGLAK